MMYRIKLQHLGHTFEMTMHAPDRQTVLQRILAIPSDAKIIYIRPDEQNNLQHPPDAR